MIGTIFGSIESFLSPIWLTALVFGGPAGAVALFILRVLGRVPRGLASLLITVLIAVGAWAYGFKGGQESERVRTQIAELEAALTEQERQRIAAEEIAVQERNRAAERETERRALEEAVRDYSAELASGGAAGCPDDDAYRRRMQSIRIGPPRRP